MESPNFFRDDSPFLRHPLLTAERTAQEIDFLMPRMGLASGSRVLDIGCGFGRHSIELARRRCTVVGIDPSAAMIAAAEQRAAEAGVAARFYQAGGEDFRSERPFDAALCLFTTLGQVSSAGDNVALLDNVSRLLRAGGLFAVETPQREVAVQTMKPSERFQGPTNQAEVTRSFDRDSNILTEVFEVSAGQERSRFILRYRLFSANELTDLLAAAGFVDIILTDGYRDAELGAEGAAMLAIGRKSAIVP